MYFITTFTKYEINKNGFPDTGATRTVGYYTNKKDAVDTILENYCDIWEHTYTYAVVEYIEPGIYNLATERWFFKWNMDTLQYEQIDSIEDNFGNYAFG